MLLSTGRLSLLLLLLGGLTAPAAAQGDDADPAASLGVPSIGEPGTGFFEARISYFDRQDNGDGNPFLDETLEVIEPVFVYDYNVSDKFAYGLKLSYDHVSSASIDRLSKYPEQSGASGDNYYGLDANFRHLYSESVTLGWNVGGSTEYDYNSLHIGGSATWEADDKNSVVSVNLNGFFDDVDVIRYNGTEDGNDTRTSIAGTVNWYQVLSPTIHGELGVTLSDQTGFLETAYNAVVLEDPSLAPNPALENDARGTEFTEELPDDRFRTAIFGRLRKLLRPGTAVELGGRYYTDDWGIDAITVEPRLYQQLTDTLRMRLRFRYYTQDPAKYWNEHFVASTPGQTTFPDRERTQDSDLGDFDAQTYGCKLIYEKNAYRFDVGVDYISRSDGLDSWLTSFGYHWSF